MRRTTIWRVRRARLSTILSVAATAATLHAQTIPNLQPTDLNRRGAGVDRLHVWVESVRLRDAGNTDEAVARVARWTSAELDDLWIELRMLHQLMDDPRRSAFQAWVDSPRGQLSRRVVYTGSELDRLRRLAVSLGGRDLREVSTPDYERLVLAARNRMLKRGALLHTAVALTNPRDVRTGPVAPFSARPDAVILFADGRQVGVDRAANANQWKFARALLGLVRPAASADSGVRAWYRASSAALLREMHLHSEHFNEALRLFPDDAMLAMLGGSLHEALASPQVQEFIRSATPPKGITLTVGSTRTELGRAETLFKRSLSIDPRSTEARLRLGRVLSLQERHADALNELRRVDPSAPAILQYYGSLFAGDAAEALGRSDDARAAYERAAALYPMAHAPRLALSQLAARAGDIIAASQTLELVLSGTPDPAPDDDPFWTYHVAVGRNADAPLAEAYRALTAEATP
jgi:tetratricopeptide (TPR) repeat protein